MTRHRLTSRTIDDVNVLRAALGEPSALVRAKVAARLNPLTRRFTDEGTHPSR